MSKVYEEEEKRMYLDAFNVSGKTKTAFARENNIILIQGYLDALNCLRSGRKLECIA